MRIGLFCFLLVLHSIAAAQYFQFSMYELAAQRINPAIGPLSEYAALDLLYRNQVLPGSQSLQSMYVQGSYPVRYSRTLRGSYGVSALDDRYGIAGIYRTNTVGFTYGLAVQVNRDQYLSFGVKGDWQIRNASLNGLTTGSQFVPDRGFLSGSNNEPLEEFNASFFTGSLGLYWAKYDRNGDQKAHSGISVYDFNEPVESFYDQSGTLLRSWVLSGGFLAYSKDRWRLYPEILFTRSSSLNVATVGAKTSYEISRKRKGANQLLLLTRYSTGGYIIAGVQLVKESMIIGCSADIPVGSSMKQPAFEVGITLRRLRAPIRPRSRRSIFFRSRRPGREPEDQPAKSGTLLSSSDSLIANNEAVDKQHGHTVYVYPGEITEKRPLMVEDTVSFNFPTNESMLDQAIKDYLHLVVDFLKENQHLEVTITGHTDDIGTHTDNYRLGLRRANEVANFLMENGIWWSRIGVESEGEENPLLPNASETNRARNRRVEVSFTY